MRPGLKEDLVTLSPGPLKQRKAYAVTITPKRMTPVNLVAIAKPKLRPINRAAHLVRLLELPITLAENITVKTMKKVNIESTVQKWAC